MVTLGLEGQKWDIFKSAVDLFFTHGYDNTSMRDIADSIGIKSAALYSHWPTKEALLDTLYQFYRQNISTIATDLDDILPRIPDMSITEVLRGAEYYFSEEIQPYMDKIYMISLFRSTFDTKANDLIWKYNIDISKRYLTAVLNRMVEIGKIEPLDIESYVEICIAFSFTALFMQNTDHPMGMEKWVRGLDYMISTIKERA